MKTTEYVICHPGNGVYLGNCMGLGLWSKLDPAGQTHAVTFPNIVIAKAHTETWENSNVAKQCDFVAVSVSGLGYATMDECEHAGLPRWDPHAENKLESESLPQWRAEYGGRILDSCDNLVATVYEPFWLMGNEGYKSRLEKMYKNCALMSASPELLECCISAVNKLNDWAIDHEPILEEIDELRQQLSRAIKNATNIKKWRLE